MPATPAVTRVVYASQSRIQGPVYAEMERIRACAVRHNEPAGVHTALAHQSVRSHRLSEDDAAQVAAPAPVTTKGSL